MSDLGKNVTADAINDSGEIMDPDWLWNGKTWTSLGGLPGGSYSNALGLNNYGQVVGETMNNNSTFEEGYLWSPSSPNGISGTMIGLGSFDKTSPGFSSAAAINGHGSVTGWAENVDLSGGAAHAFVWVPSRRTRRPARWSTWARWRSTPTPPIAEPGPGDQQQRGRRWRLQSGGLHWPDRCHDLAARRRWYVHPERPQQPDPQRDGMDADAGRRDQRRRAHCRGGHAGRHSSCFAVDPPDHHRGPGGAGGPRDARHGAGPGPFAGGYLRRLGRDRRRRAGRAGTWGTARARLNPDRIAAPPAAVPIFDFALADLAARRG